MLVGRQRSIAGHNSKTKYIAIGGRYLGGTAPDRWHVEVLNGTTFETVKGFNLGPEAEYASQVKYYNNKLYVLGNSFGLSVIDLETDVVTVYSAGFFGFALDIDEGAGHIYVGGFSGGSPFPGRFHVRLLSDPSTIVSTGPDNTFSSTPRSITHDSNRIYMAGSFNLNPDADRWCVLDKSDLSTVVPVWSGLAREAYCIQVDDTHVYIGGNFHPDTWKEKMAKFAKNNLTTPINAQMPRYGTSTAYTVADILVDTNKNKLYIAKDFATTGVIPFEHANLPSTNTAAITFPALPSQLVGRGKALAQDLTHVYLILDPGAVGSPYLSIVNKNTLTTRNTYSRIPTANLANRKAIAVWER